MLDLIHLHPVVVHFPIALITVGVLFDILGIALKREDLTLVGKWDMLFGSTSLVFVVATGLLAEAAVGHTEEAHDLMTLHKRIGITVLVLLGSLAIMRVVIRDSLLKRYQNVFLVLSIIGVLFITYGAYLGGRLVYDYGVAVSTSTVEQGVNPKEIEEEHRHGAHEH